MARPRHTLALSSDISLLGGVTLDGAPIEGVCGVDMSCGPEGLMDVRLTLRSVVLDSVPGLIGFWVAHPEGGGGEVKRIEWADGTVWPPQSGEGA